MNNTWFPIKFAPIDRDIKYTSISKEGLPILTGIVKYHEDAGFTVDEFRDPEYWQPLDNMCPFCLERQIKYEDAHFCDECDSIFNNIMNYHLNHTVTIQDSIELLAHDLDPKKKEFIAYWWTA